MRLEWTPQQGHLSRVTNWWLHEVNDEGYRRGVASVCPSNVRHDVLVWEARVADTAERKFFTDLDEAKAWAVVTVRLQ